MQRPYKYLVIDKRDNSFTETNIEPNAFALNAWIPCENNPLQSKMKQVKEVYIDTRYTAKLRLYNYVTFPRKGLRVPKYRPYEGTNIGKTEPILNF